MILLDSTSNIYIINVRYFATSSLSKRINDLNLIRLKIHLVNKYFKGRPSFLEKIIKTSFDD